jgi:hypothetical protein
MTINLGPASAGIFFCGERFPRETSAALTFCDPGTPDERMRYAQLSRKMNVFIART